MPPFMHQSLLLLRILYLKKVEQVKYYIIYSLFFIVTFKFKSLVGWAHIVVDSLIRWGCSSHDNSPFFLDKSQEHKTISTRTRTTSGDLPFYQRNVIKWRSSVSFSRLIEFSSNYFLGSKLVFFWRRKYLLFVKTLFLKNLNRTV